MVGRKEVHTDKINTFKRLLNTSLVTTSGSEHSPFWLETGAFEVLQVKCNPEMVLCNCADTLTYTLDPSEQNYNLITPERAKLVAHN